MAQRQQVKDDLVRALQSIGVAMRASGPIEGALHKYTIGSPGQFLQVDRTGFSGRVKAWLTKDGSDDVIEPVGGPWIDEQGLASWAETQFGVADVAASATALTQPPSGRQRSAPERLVAAPAPQTSNVVDLSKAALSRKRPAAQRDAITVEETSRTPEPTFRNVGIQRLDAALAALAAIEDTQLAENWYDKKFEEKRAANTNATDKDIGFLMMQTAMPTYEQLRKEAESPLLDLRTTLQEAEHAAASARAKANAAEVALRKVTNDVTKALDDMGLPGASGSE